jgi:hypothetical protein
VSSSAKPTEDVTAAIHVDNKTSLVVSVFINDHGVAVVPPTTYGAVVAPEQVTHRP